MDFYGPDRVTVGSTKESDWASEECTVNDGDRMKADFSGQISAGSRMTRCNEKYNNKWCKLQFRRQDAVCW